MSLRGSNTEAKRRLPSEDLEEVNSRQRNENVFPKVEKWNRLRPMWLLQIERCVESHGQMPKHGFYRLGRNSGYALDKNVDRHE